MNETLQARQSAAAHLPRRPAHEKRKFPRRQALVLAMALLLLAGCGRGSGPVSMLPGTDAIPGWTPAGEAQRFGADTLYNLVDGQAESYFAYAFEEVAVQTYQNAEGASLRVEIWQVATPADAYGLFTSYRGGTPVAIGNEGDADPGRRLGFWQDRYVVSLFAIEPLPDTYLQTVAQAVAGKLPRGGEPPELLSRLPQEGLVERSALYFHQEISIQTYLWLGGENLLKLGPDTDGILARHQIGEGNAQLLLIEYPDASAASTALNALRAAPVDNLIAAQVDQNLLVAVFGTVTEAQAHALLTSALSPP
jgi:hypothetical protein